MQLWMFVFLISFGDSIKGERRCGYCRDPLIREEDRILSRGMPPFSLNVKKDIPPLSESPCTGNDDIKLSLCDNSCIQIRYEVRGREYFLRDCSEGMLRAGPDNRNYSRYNGSTMLRTSDSRGGSWQFEFCNSTTCFGDPDAELADIQSNSFEDLGFDDIWEDLSVSAQTADSTTTARITKTPVPVASSLSLSSVPSTTTMSSTSETPSSHTSRVTMATSDSSILSESQLQFVLQLLRLLLYVFVLLLLLVLIYFFFRLSRYLGYRSGRCGVFDLLPLNKSRETMTDILDAESPTPPSLSLLSTPIHIV